MSATATTCSIGTALALKRVNDPTVVNTKFTAIKTSVDNAFSATPTIGHTHNGVDSAYISGPVGVGIDAIQSSGSPFAVGTLVYVTGKSGVNYTVAKAQAKSPSNTSLYAAFICLAALASGVAGQVFKIGRLTGLDTSGGTIARPVWLSNTAGGWSVVLLDPLIGYGAQIVGWVETVHASAGVINFDIQGPIPWSLADQI